ncbi:N-acyl homoserine lactonase family protein [Trinickia diaoshuihuensis]|uniref:N-acyl homoserine lactonase family protein n=1 Tax=Trinickia diaoshuihuensis TaxID=2292265 RepID=UPI000E25C342|nr:N-acyl homoserine lactonase family protein [Trinickia diaoshuihuensis]
MNSTFPPEYEVYALRYAVQPDRTARENYLFYDEHDGPMPQDYFIWAIRDEARVIVVDTGFTAEMAAKRKRTFLRSPIAALAGIGIDASQVRDVVITHMHYDHAGNLDAFPQARFHVQDKEMQYCTGRCMCYDLLRRPFEKYDVITAVRHLFEGRLVFHDGDETLAPGVSLHLIGGHTLGQQVVRVHTKRGYIVLASDGAHYWSNIRSRKPFPLVADVMLMLEGYTRIDALADGPEHVIPGHDPAVLTTFPTWPSSGDVALLHEAPIAHAERTDGQTALSVQI